MTYVTVEDDDDDDWVTYAAAAGYTGMMVAWGCAVWGTGYYYPPYYGWGGYYPYYYPHYPTYGYGAYYNPWTGAYGRIGGGLRALRRRRRDGALQPADRHLLARRRGVGALRRARCGGQRTTRGPAPTRRPGRGPGVYGSWGSTAVQRGDNWAQTSRVTNRQTGTTTRVTQGVRRRRGGYAPWPGGRHGGVARTGSGDVYAGHDGNVYRKEGDSLAEVRQRQLG